MKVKIGLHQFDIYLYAS